MQMDSPVIESFFKPMRPDFLTTLRLPPIISRKVAESKAEEAILISGKGTWKVNICQNRDGLVCFEEGWDSFVQEHGLKIGDFAVFEHVGNLHFKVSMFCSCACGKEYSTVGTHEDEPHLEPTVYEQTKTTKQGRPTKETESYHKEAHLGAAEYQQIRSNKSGRPTKKFLSDEQNSRLFKKKIMPYNLNQKCPTMYFPRYFVRANNIGCKASIILRGPSEESVPGELKWHGKKNLLYLSSSEWIKFCTSNKIKVGDDCLFQLNHTPAAGSNAFVMDVQIFPAPS